VRENRGGKIYALSYAKVSSMAPDPVEKKPLFHFYPGSLVFSLGSLGCNLRCIHCQNWEIAHSRMVGEEPGVVDLQPEEAVRAAKRYSCQGLAWTYNEPTIWLEYTLDSAKLCRKEKLYTVYVTNGYTTPEALDEMGPYLDAYRVDVKGFTEEFYRKLAKVLHLKPVLEAAIRAKKNWNMHVEIVTNVIPTMNDDEGQLRGIARWIRDNLGDKTPWHVTRFIPYLELSHLYPTPVRTLERAREIGFEEGLKFVYIGNVPGHPGENTRCPRCKELVIERSGYSIMRFEVEGGKCKHCGEGLNIRG
jgi:pyruvate formate lyase activating enzyme